MINKQIANHKNREIKEQHNISRRNYKEKNFLTWKDNGLYKENLINQSVESAIAPVEVIDSVSQMFYLVVQPKASTSTSKASDNQKVYALGENVALEIPITQLDNHMFTLLLPRTWSTRLVNTESYFLKNKFNKLKAELIKEGTTVEPNVIIYHYFSINTEVLKEEVLNKASETRSSVNPGSGTNRMASLQVSWRENGVYDSVNRFLATTMLQREKTIASISVVQSSPLNVNQNSGNFFLPCHGTLVVVILGTTCVVGLLLLPFKRDPDILSSEIDDDPWLETKSQRLFTKAPTPSSSSSRSNWSRLDCVRSAPISPILVQTSQDTQVVWGDSLEDWTYGGWDNELLTSEDTVTRGWGDSEICQFYPPSGPFPPLIGLKFDSLKSQLKTIVAKAWRFFVLPLAINMFAVFLVGNKRAFAANSAATVVEEGAASILNLDQTAVNLADEVNQVINTKNQWIKEEKKRIKEKKKEKKKKRIREKAKIELLQKKQTRQKEDLLTKIKEKKEIIKNFCHVQPSIKAGINSNFFEEPSIGQPNGAINRLGRHFFASFFGELGLKHQGFGHVLVLSHWNRPLDDGFFTYLALKGSLPVTYRRALSLVDQKTFSLSTVSLENLQKEHNYYDQISMSVKENPPGYVIGVQVAVADSCRAFKILKDGPIYFKLECEIKQRNHVNINTEVGLYERLTPNPAANTGQSAIKVYAGISTPVSFSVFYPLWAILFSKE